MEWASPSKDIWLRAYSLKPKTYYRMDHHPASGSRSYRWPTDVLQALKLTRRDIGIVAYTERNDGSGRMYLPVRIGVPPEGAESTYELVVIPGKELKEVFVGLSAVGTDGTRTEVSAARPLGYGFYPAGRSIRIPVGPVARPGTYLLEIGATLRDGGAVSHEVRFVEAAERE